MAALVASAAAGGDGSTSTTAGINTTGADLIMVCVGGLVPASGTLTDSKGNTWQALTVFGSVNNKSRWYYAINPTVGAAHTFTFTNSSAFCSLAVLAFSGADTTAPFDQENGASASSVTSHQPGSVTPTVNDEVLVATLSFDASNTISVNSSFTISDQVDLGTCYGIAAAYKIQTSAGAENPTFSWGSSATVSAAIATFKAAAGGGQTAEVPVGLIEFLGVAPTTAKSATPPIALVDLLGVAPGTSKAAAVAAAPIDFVAPSIDGAITAEVPAAPIDFTAPAPATAKSAGLDAAPLEIAAIAPGTSKSASLGSGAVDFLGLAPTTAKSAAVPPGLLELLGIAPGSSKSASLSPAVLEFLAITPDTTGGSESGTPCRLMGTLTVQPRFPGQLTIQPRFPGTLTVK